MRRRIDDLEETIREMECDREHLRNDIEEGAIKQRE